MDRRSQGLDEDWSEDALSAEEEIAEDRDLLGEIQKAVSSITGAKGVGSAGGDDGDDRRARDARSSDVVLGLLSGGRRTKDVAADDPDAEVWHESETHEGCQIFGYIDVSRAPGTLHFAPHSPRHSFDFSSVNTTHYIDHLSFGLELSSRDRQRLPAAVQSQLASLDGSYYASTHAHETKEHHVNVMPT
jgi:hypothetical protein